MNPFTYRPKYTNNFNPQDSFISCKGDVADQQKIISISEANIEKQFQIYKWRTQTQFPIVKVKKVQTLQEDIDLKNTCSYRKIKITYSPLPACLSEIGQIHLFKLLYLLKESLIGFERLYTKFGSFIVNEEMIFIDKQGKCKVWINHQIYSNQILTTKQKETQFLNHIFLFFQTKVIQGKASNLFFQTIKASHSFFSALQIIQKFAEKQKIKIPLNFKLTDSLKGSTSLQKKKKTRNNLNLTMSKKPSFLKNLQIQNKKECQKQSSLMAQCSFKILPIKTYFNKPPMKISGDTAAQSIKSFHQVRPAIKKFEPKLWKGSQKQIVIGGSQQQKNMKLKCQRKFSNNIQNRQNPQSRNDLFSSNNYKKGQNNDGLSGQIAQSIIFDGKSSISRSDSEEDMPLQKKKQLFNINGWSLRVDSLFQGKTEQKKSYIKKDALSLTVKQPVKLQLLDRCTTNMCQSFMSNNSDY